MAHLFEDLAPGAREVLGKAVMRDLVSAENGPAWRDKLVQGLRELVLSKAADPELIKGAVLGIQVIDAVANDRAASTDQVREVERLGALARQADPSTRPGYEALVEKAADLLPGRPAQLRARAVAIRQAAAGHGMARESAAGFAAAAELDERARVLELTQVRPTSVPPEELDDLYRELDAEAEALHDRIDAVAKSAMTTAPGRAPLVLHKSVAADSPAGRFFAVHCKFADVETRLADLMEQPVGAGPVKCTSEQPDLSEPHPKLTKAADLRRTASGLNDRDMADVYRRQADQLEAEASQERRRRAIYP